MLDLPRYLLGVLEIALLAGFATLGGAAVRARLLPAFSGLPAHLATAVLALALLIWAAELLGSFRLFDPLSYLVTVIAAGLALRWLLPGRGCPPGAAASRFSPQPRPRTAPSASGEKPSKPGGHPRPPSPATLIAVAIAAIALVKFGLDAKPKLTTGMTGFDSTWYHGPFAAGFFQSGDTWSLHFIAPQFLAWFYPANAELFHATGMLAFGRDLLSPLLNIGWFFGCLTACWCIGKPYRVAPWSLALGAVALSLPVLSDQAGEARNDIVAIFFLLAAFAVALNAFAGNEKEQGRNGGDSSCIGAFLVIGLAAGLAAGTKLNFLLPAAVLVLGLPLLAPAGRRRRALAAAVLAALAGGGYWYLRNLVHTGNPLPWFDSLGPISLPAPDQALGGREGHTVLGYLTDGSVWSDWFLPGLHGGLTVLWPLVGALALAGLLLAVFQPRSLPTPSRFGSLSGPNLDSGRGGALLLAGLTGLAAAFAWLIAPTSASGLEGAPRGFESGLRYLAPALVLGLTVLPVALLPRVARWRGTPIAEEPAKRDPSTWGKPPRHPRADASGAATGPAGRGAARHLSGRGAPHAGPALLALVTFLALIAIGYPVQRHYLRDRYADPTFATPGLNAAFALTHGDFNARTATTSTRQYPFFGTDLSNEVQYIGERQPHGGFVAPTTCPRWRRLLNAGNYDLVVTTRDRIEPGRPPYPATTRWTEGPGATPILRKPPTVVFKLTGPLDPSAC